MTERLLLLTDGDVAYHPSANGLSIHWELFQHILQMTDEPLRRFIVGKTVDSGHAKSLAAAIENIERGMSFDAFLHSWADPDATVLKALADFLMGGEFQIELKAK